MFYDINKSVLVERLFVPERVRTGYDEKFLFLLNQVRTNLLDGIPVQNTNRKRVYISRKHATNGRRIVNEAELIQLLEQYNFETVIMEHKSLKDQIELMANAGWLIGANGAGIVHCLFMPEASFIIELFSPNYIHPCMDSAIQLCNHQYFMMPSYNDRDYKYGEDIYAYLDLIRLTLRSQLRNKMNT